MARARDLHPPSGPQQAVTAIRDEMSLLRKEVEKLTRKVDGSPKRPPA